MSRQINIEEHTHGGDWRTRGTGSSYFERDSNQGRAGALASRPMRTGGRGEGLADGLGWLSLALGAAATAAPSRVAHLVGLRADRDTCNVIRAVGFREIASGAGILAEHRPAGWMWARAGGDAMDLALLGSAFRRRQAHTGRLMAAAGAVVGIAALDLLVARRLSNGGLRAGRAAAGRQADREISVHEAITVNKPRADVYAFWRDFKNMPRFMNHLDSVEVIDDRRSRWRAKAPAGMKVEWEAEITEDVPNERISWRSLPGSDIENHGTVSFTPAPGGHGTEIHVQFAYVPPAGQLGRYVAKVLGEDPEWQVRDDLRHFKQLLETGEIPLSDASVTGGPARPAKRNKR